ncbi:hypothetical protein OIU77_031492 [Salix suchowensis]|uniref:Pentatricopeptide repeat-containing protein n=1 Tax=Salix suchowensis TaxID=1278906 RepID=A0ABQ9BFN4_9ROSI|nr:hypothetical protein OIU77_031492 [Salix suchowensis]
MAVLILSSSSMCCSCINYSIAFRLSGFRHKNGPLGGEKFGTLRVFPCESNVNWKKNKKKQVAFCGFALKSQNEELVVNGKPRKWLSSDEVLGVLHSISDPIHALLYFKSVAELPNVVHTTETCNHMLEVLRVHRRVEDMAFVFDLMQRQIIRRNANTYLIIFKGLFIRGGLRRAPSALEKMREAGFVLNAYSYNGLIHFLLQAGFCKEALEVYRRMVSEGLKPSLKTFSALMVASGKRRNVKTVMGLLEEMESIGLRPNIYTYTICIRILGRAGKIDEAYRIMKRMDDDGCGPDVVTYTVLIDALCTARKLDDAMCLFTKMKSSSHKPDKVTYVTLLDKFSDCGDLVRVKKVWTEMEADGYAPDVVTFTILVKALCKAGRINEAFDLLDTMRKHRGLTKSPYLQHIDFWTFEGKQVR